MSWIYNDPPKLAHKFFSVNYFTSLQRTLLPPRLRLTNHHLPYILQDRNRINIQHHSMNLISLYLILFFSQHSNHFPLTFLIFKNIWFTQSLIFRLFFLLSYLLPNFLFFHSSFPFLSLPHSYKYLYIFDFI